MHCHIGFLHKRHGSFPKFLLVGRDEWDDLQNVSNNSYSPLRVHLCSTVFDISTCTFEIHCGKQIKRNIVKTATIDDK